ncbi:MAG TPA: lectin, partial [Actinospica sp.]|nr:lectin [Actinospica sp.]
LNTTPTQATVPTNSGLLSLDEDGTACSADYYMRLTGDGGKMLKGQIALTSTRPTSPTGSSSNGGGGGGCGSLNANQQLTVNQSTVSCDSRFNLVLGGDGNLVLYEGSTALWSSGTAGKASARAIMQGDGNFVIYDSSSNPLWSSGTAGNNGAYLLVQNDGNTVIYSSSGTGLWSTNTGGH